MAEENKFYLKKDFFFLSAIVFVHVVCWLAMKPIFPQGDPLVYFINAKRILNQEYFFSYSVQSHRYGVFVPQAILIKLFGENPYAINLWTLLCSTSTISLLYFFLLKFLNRTTAIIAGLLLSVNLIQVIYSSTVFPDMIVSFFGLCCIYFVYKGREEQYLWRKNSALFILSFAFGFSAKESIIVTLPFIAFIFWKDWKEKQFFYFQRSVIVFLILFSVFVFSISKSLTGSFLFFYDSYSHYEVFLPLQNFSELLKNVFIEMPQWLNAQLGYIFPLLFSIPACIDGLKRKDKIISLQRFLSYYVIILFLTLCCGSISIFHFGYIPMVDRRWMMLIAPLCILSAISIYKIVQGSFEKHTFYFLIISLALLSILNFIEYSLQRGVLFFVFALMLFIERILKEKFKTKEGFRVILVMLPFIILACYFILKNSNYVVPQPSL